MEKQINLTGETIKEDWEKEWQEMPEFIQVDKSAFRQIIVNFETEEDVKKFMHVMNRRLTDKTKSIWFPENRKEAPSLFRYIKEDDDGK